MPKSNKTPNNDKESSPEPTSPTLIGSLLKPPNLYLLLAVLIPLSGLGSFYALHTYYTAHPELTPPPIVNSIVMQNQAASEDLASPSPTPSPSPSPLPLKPDNGTQGTYKVSQGKHSGPTISQVIFDPLDAQEGQSLTFIITLAPKSHANSVSATLTMDNSQTTIDFEKVQDDENGQETWKAKILLPDTILYKYILTVTSTNEEGSATISVAPRS